MMNREELEAELKILDLVDAANAAKEKVRGGDDSAKARKALHDAKEALAAARQDSRANRVPTEPAEGDGVAKPKTVAVKTSTEGG